MVTHSEAKAIWQRIKNIKETGDPMNKYAKAESALHFFPYRQTMSNAKHIDVANSMVQISLYFKHLTPQTTGGYEKISSVWLGLVPYIPQQYFTEPYKKLTEYFKQKETK